MSRSNLYWSSSGPTVIIDFYQLYLLNEKVNRVEIVGQTNLPPLRGLCDLLMYTYHYKFANSSVNFYIMAPSAENFEGVNHRWENMQKNEEF